MLHSSKKVGIIDSGIGGLSILKELLAKNLNAEYFYISDEQNVPYGNKDQAFMLKQMTEMAQKLIDKSVSIILIACNTATAETINQLRQKFPDQTFVGIEPYINYLNKTNVKDKKVALILTQATFRSSRFKDLVKRQDPHGEIKIYPLENLAMIIESLKYRSFDSLQHQIDSQLDILKEKSIDLLILGCTHYPIIKNYIERSLRLETINPTGAVVQQLIKVGDLKSAFVNNSMFHYNHNNRENWSIICVNDLNFLDY